MPKGKVVVLLILFLSLLSCRDRQSLNGSAEPDEAPYFQVKFDPGKPGCGNCHSSTGQWEMSLAALANRSWAEHNFDPGKRLMTIRDCLRCHQSGNHGKAGSIAPTPLRSIVHEGHTGKTQLLHDDIGRSVQANCFLCHVIMGDSTPALYGEEH